MIPCINPKVLVPLSDVAKFSAGEEPSIRSLKRQGMR